MNSKITYIDLFSGAGGLSEGFTRAGFTPIAHVELDKAACNTLLTRTAYFHLLENSNIQPYLDYIQNKGISRNKLYSFLPDKKINSVINIEIGKENNSKIFKQIDSLRNEKQVDLIIGGPPCQAYSIAGRSRDENRMVKDPRNYLFVEYAKFLEYFQPKYFVFENVVGLLSAKTPNKVSYIKLMIDLFKKKGYSTEYKVLEAKNFGVLQNRKRVILIGKKGNYTNFYPTFENKPKDVTIDEILKDLPKLLAGEGHFFTTKYKKYSGKYLYDTHIRNGLDFTTQHIARPHNEQDKEIYKIAVDKWNKYKERLNYNDLPERLKTHKNTKSFLDRFKVVACDKKYSQTVVAHIAKDGHYYIHPDINQNRSLTPREAARLQTFPDDFYFEGVSEKPSRTAAFKQIGNAVPPLMAESIAYKLKEIILND